TVPRLAEPFTQSPQAAPDPLLMSHGVAGNLISEQPFQCGEDSRVLHFSQLPPRTWSTHAVCVPHHAWPPSGYRRHRARRGGSQPLQFFRPGANLIAGEAGRGADHLLTSRSQYTSLGGGP